MKRNPIRILLTLLASCPWVAVAAESPVCDKGWTTIRARVVQIDPAASAVQVRSANGSVRPAGLGAVLCSGDTIENAAAAKLVIQEAGKAVPVTTQSYRVGAGPAVTTAAAQYIAGLLDIVGGLRPSVPRALPTAARNGQGSSAGYERVAPISALRNLPRQKLTLDQHVLLAWRGGAAPYRCQGFAEDMRKTWESQPTPAGWCHFNGELALTSRLVIEDERGASTGWNLQPVSWSDVPRPAWITVATESATTDHVAWAAWLWRSGGPPWRLQAMAMLNTLSASEPLGTEFLERILDENLPLEP